MAGPAAVLTIADLQLVSALRRGDPAAEASLWARWKGPLWTICGAMAADRDQAVALLAGLYADLPALARGFTPDLPLCCQVGAAAFSGLSRALELPAPDGIDVVIPVAVQVPTPDRIRDILDRLDPVVRLTYLVDLYFGCPAPLLAALLDVDPNHLRNARAQAAWTLIQKAAP